MPLKLQTTIPQGGIPVVSLKDYLSQDRTIVIPPWQREYSWKTTSDLQVDTLMKDLFKFLKDPKRNEYLMGSLVLCQLKDDEKRPLLIDGQQRTLTLTLLLMCCQKFLLTSGTLNNNNVSDSQLVSDLQSCITKNAYAVLQPRVEMKQSSAEETLRAIYAWSIEPGEYKQEVFKNLDKQNETQKNLIQAAEFIYKEMVGNLRTKKDGSPVGNPGNWLTAEELKACIYDLLNNVKFIEIVVDEKRESISVFDHINNRGMALNPADLVKNLMFQAVPDNQFEDISENWESMLSNLMDTKKSRLSDPRYLLRSVSHVEYGAHKSYDDLDIFWSEKFEEHAKSPHLGISAKDFSKKLLDYSEHLKALVTRDAKYAFPLDEIYLAGELGSVQHYSILLAGTKLKNRDSFAHLCRQVNLRTLLYMFSEEKTQEFDAMIPKWASAVYSLKPEASKSEINQAYRDSKAIPDDKLFAALRENMSSWNYTNPSQKKKIRAVLGLLSVELNNYCNDPVTIEDAMRTMKRANRNTPWQIDHVMAQSSTKDDLYHSIGNLVLLTSTANNNASAISPKDKEPYYAESSLILTKTLTGTSFVNTTHSEKAGKLLESLRISPKEWELNDWNSDSVGARMEFYYSYLSSLIKAAGV